MCNKFSIVTELLRASFEIWIINFYGIVMMIFIGNPKNKNDYLNNSWK